MATKPEPHVAVVERIDGGVYIVFDSGEAAVYSGALLYSILSQAAPVSTVGDAPSEAAGDGTA